ncbi:hypothetical protein M409DRAFT_25229 [Zasmidium cellare ATCC 36951]|uniref:Uncharacterized protein n=1 Tax=Zasmidium cellare ATCC 36951 TaxID=1080233 RepID=A0A6A6CDQ2_ZASCE|nr:uncharacterized protein M409DRAFT_25229 [Zasmidium cellare ATCC 36951]KAF2164350.1 hypothetical protein M409DRAFT_25229 [Zasmidium cellare ATCC 36951]
MYEGNFDEWVAYTTAIFTKQGKPHQVYPAIRLYYRSGTVKYYKSTLGDIRVLLDSISEHLLNRIPSDLELGELCKPFRLFDLPAEFRVKIYENVIPVGVRQSLSSSPECDCGNDYFPRRGGVPALAQASKQVRQEALPVYFSSTTFYLDRGDRENEVNLRSWKSRYLHGSARFLWALDVTVDALRGPVELDNYGAESDGLECVVLEVRYHGLSRGVELKARAVPTLKAESKEKLAALAAEVNMEAKKRGLKAEMVLTVVQRLFEETNRNPRSENPLGLFLEDEDEEEEWDWGHED